MLSCKQATFLASQAQERSLTRREKMQFKVHLMVCSSCRNFNKNINNLHNLMQQFKQHNDDDVK
jgi:predicted anti-sigma-YlaC factor YlaD